MVIKSMIIFKTHNTNSTTGLDPEPAQYKTYFKQYPFQYNTLIPISIFQVANFQDVSPPKFYINFFSLLS